MDLNVQFPLPHRKDFRIGILGAGAVVDDCHLPAYRKAGYNPVTIASRTRARAEQVAQRHGIPKVYDSIEQLLDAPSVEVLDIAVPPMHQLDLIKAACQRRTVKAILAQVPLGRTYREAVEAVQACEKAGIVLAVNQRLRYDPAIRAAKLLLSQGRLGEPVVATLDVRAIPEWRGWCKELGSLTLLLFSVHHLDVFRYWFGTPEGIYCSVRKDPRVDFEHTDGICSYIVEYTNGLRCVGIDDCWTGPANDCPREFHARWRIEGLKGLASGNIGWCRNPAQPPAIRHAVKGMDEFQHLTWEGAVGADAFMGTMAELLIALETGHEPAISGRDNLMTMALVEAARESTRQFRSIGLADFVRAATKSMLAAAALEAASEAEPNSPPGILQKLSSKLEELEPPPPVRMSNYTPRAQQVLALAREEADRFFHNFVGTEHLLLGLIRLGQGVAVNVLRRQGLDLETVRKEIEKQVGTGPDQKMIGNIPFTPRVKKVLQLAVKEQEALKHTYVGTEHILLGLLREGDGVAARVLRNLDVNIKQTRQEILKELDPNYGQ